MNDIKIKMSEDEFYRNYSLAQELTSKYLVRNHIYSCQSSLVDDVTYNMRR